MGRFGMVMMVTAVLLTPGCGRKAREQRLREHQTQAAPQGQAEEVAPQETPPQETPVQEAQQAPLPEEVAPYHSSRLPSSRPEAKPRAPVVSREELEMIDQLLPGCIPDSTSTEEERVLYCPGQAVFFAVRGLEERSPDAAFNQWVEEQNQRAYGTLEVLERTEVKTFGPQFVTLYFRMRTPQMPRDAYLESYVALTEVNGQRRRVWCSATHSEPMGRQRCESDLQQVSLIDPPGR